MTEKRRLAIVASHVIQYQDPFFRLLAREPEIDLTVIYCSRQGAESYVDREMQTELRWDLEMLTGYEHLFLHNLGRGERYARLLNPGIVPALIRGRYDAVIFMTGWGTVTSLLGMIACRFSGTPYFLFGDSSFPPAEDDARGRIRAGLMRLVVGSADGAMISGALNAGYYRHYGADPGRFFALPFAIDNARFAAAGRLEPAERSAMRARLGFDERTLVIVFSGKLVPRKDPMTLLRAVDAMSNRDRAAVLFLGHGELREELEQFAGARGIRAAFPGFVNQTEIPRHYALGDVLVLPSTFEPRGLVVNEAMAVGLPVITSDRVGASGDLAGDVFPAGDHRALAKRLDALIDDPIHRQEMTSWSREKIATWSFEAGVQGVKEALRACR